MDPLKSHRRFCVAPMMRRSHRPARAWWRALCPGALLYTEMIVADAVLRGGRLRAESAEPGPVALQLGGSDPDTISRAAKVGERMGFAEVNLNCGCPSGRVKRGEFGASLMRRPELVADIVRAAKDAVSVPVTVKCRIAVDEMDPESGLNEFARATQDAGCDALIVHARKAWLDGLSPAQNRAVPPLDLARVRRLKSDFPSLPIVVNGGLQNIADACRELKFADGAMLGRAVVRDPMLLTDAAREVFGETNPLSRDEALARGIELASESSPREMRLALEPLAGLRRGLPDARAFRRKLAECVRPDELFSAADGTASA